MGIEPTNRTLSLADSTPLAPVTRLNPGYQYPVLDYSWTTNFGPVLQSGQFLLRIPGWLHDRGLDDAAIP